MSKLIAFQHPLGLFQLQHSPDWGADYDSGSGTLGLLRAEAEGRSALHFIPLAITGAPVDPVRLLLEHAQRLGVWLPAESIQVTEDAHLHSALGEARRPALDEGSASPLRFWVTSRKGLAVVITQLGPATDSPAIRAEADTIVASLVLPEVVPPTPAEFLTSVLKVLRREHPQLVDTVTGEWEIEVRDDSGNRVVTLDLAPPYAEALSRPAEAEQVAQELIAQRIPPDGTRDAAE